MDQVETNTEFEDGLVAHEQVSTEVHVPDHHGHGAFYEGPEFWVGLSFVLVVLCLLRPISKVFGSMIDKRIEGIADRISEVKRLNEDSKKLLTEYEAKYKNASSEAKEILKKSEREIALIKKDRMEKLERDLAAKQKEAEERIRHAQEDALKEITELTSEMTIKALKVALAKNLSPKMQDKLIEESIAKIKKTAK